MSAGGPGGRVRVLTDSTSYLPPELAERVGVLVVPLEVVVAGVAYAESAFAPADLAAALRRRDPVTTSRPAPATLLAAYERLAVEGATHVVSVHLSGEMSGTCASARLAARDTTAAVHVVDSRQLGMGLGYAVLAAAGAAAGGADAQEVASAAMSRASRTRAFFCVDTLEHLRRGGRIRSTQAALIGSALAVKPLLHLLDGRVEPLERVRTSSRGLARLLELAVSAAGRTPVEVTVHHLDSHRRADELAARLVELLPSAQLVGDPQVVELGAVVGAHVGPGTVAVVVAPAF